MASIGRHDVTLHGHTNISGKQDLGRDTDRRWHEDRFILFGELDNEPCHSGAIYNGSVICLSVWGVASAALLHDCFPKDAVNAAGVHDETSKFRMRISSSGRVRSHLGMRSTPTGGTCLLLYKEIMWRTD